MRQKPSVLFINRVYPPQKGATGRLLRDLALGFADDGWDVTVLASAREPRDRTDGPVKIQQVATSGDKTIFQYALVGMRLLKAARKMPRHDLIVTLSDPPMLVTLGASVARKSKAKHIHWCHDLYPDLLPVLGVHLPRSLQNYMHNNSRRAMKSCDRVIAIGRCMAKYLARTGVDHTKISVIPNWPDRELTQSERVSPAPVKEGAFNIAPAGKALLIDSNPKFRVLYAGTLGRAHPTATILAAAEILQKEHPEIEFVFVGEGEGHEDLATERTRLGLENMRFLPPQPLSNLKDLMESGDVHLVSMAHEALGMIVPCKVYSAIAARRPCIFLGPDKCETARLIQDHGAGMVIAQGEGPALAEAIKSYRLNGDQWFAAHQGAGRAATDCEAGTALKTWIKRARDIIQ